jgi:hypothetical protein
VEVVEAVADAAVVESMKALWWKLETMGGVLFLLNT